MMTTAPNDQVLRLRAIRSERCAASDRNTCARSSESAELLKFGAWRREKMGREPKSSTLNTHNSALNRVFDEAVVRGLLARKDVPVLMNKGRNGQRRPDFTQSEYNAMLASFPAWIAEGRAGKSRQMRG